VGEFALWVQAGAALALVLITAALAFWTRSLSRFTRDYAELARILVHGAVPATAGREVC
jgi:hypothetical protein